MPKPSQNSQCVWAQAIHSILRIVCCKITLFKKKCVFHILCRTASQVLKFANKHITICLVKMWQNPEAWAQNALFVVGLINLLKAVTKWKQDRDTMVKYETIAKPVCFLWIKCFIPTSPTACRTFKSCEQNQNRKFRYHTVEEILRFPHIT